MDFVKKHRSHISGFQRCVRYWEDKRYRKELKHIKESGIFNKGGENNVRTRFGKKSS